MQKYRGINSLAELVQTEREREKEKAFAQVSLLTINRGALKDLSEEWFEPRTLDAFVTGLKQGKTSFSINIGTFEGSEGTITNALRKITPEEWKNLKHLSFSGHDHQHLGGSSMRMLRVFVPEVCKKAVDLEVFSGDIAFFDHIKDLNKSCEFWAYQDDTSTAVPQWKEQFQKKADKHGIMCRYMQ
jgi:hypothetical protein